MVQRTPDDNREIDAAGRISAAPVSKVSQFAPGSDPADAFSTLLEGVRRDVDARLAGFLDARVADSTRHGADVEAMAKAVRDLTLRGGKRLRPALVLVGYLAHDDTISEEPALDAGVALELLQTYLLVHDDWMDGDDLRRGGPSVPAMLRRHHGSRELGDAAAILAGDYAAALSLDVLSRLDAPAERVVRALSLFAEIQQHVICGQQIDIVGRVREVEAFYGLKTGSYTVRGPLLLGAILAGAPRRLAQILEEYAAPMGIAFQMQDDLLGVFGDPKRTGKPVGEDLRKGKSTVVLHKAQTMLTGADRKLLDAVVGNASARPDELDALTHVLDDKGVRSAVIRRISELIREALDALVDAPVSASSRAWLLGAASLIASRID